MGLIQESLQFQGQWRSYQKRVLDHAPNYLQDHKIHIVTGNPRYLLKTKGSRAA